MLRGLGLLLALTATAALAGCGGTPHKSRPAPAHPSTTAKSSTTTQAASATTPSALQAEATSAAAGDIPDNQAFIVFRNGAAGYSMKYPEGWAQQGAGSQVTFRNTNNIVRVVVRPGHKPTGTEVAHELAALAGAHVQKPPQLLLINGTPAIKAVYTTESVPNTVTGKRVTLTVDRYYLAHAGKVAIVDLGSPLGVDNVDAYRLMIQSVRWN